MKIIRLIRVVDTRQYYEGSDDRFHPIPGSGDERPCDRCGRIHEVHAYVELEGNKQAIVGVGCAEADDVELAARFKTAGSLAKRLAKLDAEEKAYNERAAKWDAAFAEVESRPLPEIRILPLKDDASEVRIGEDGWARARNTELLVPRYKAERIACAVDGWRRARLTEMGVAQFRPRPASDFAKKRSSILRAMKSLTDPLRTVTPVAA